MSFLMDPPMVFAAGILLYFIGNKLGFERLAKMAIGLLIVLALYPVWIYPGYASSLLLTKRLRVSKEVYSYKDVKSRKKIDEMKYSVVRYPDKRGINDAQHAKGAGIQRDN